MTDITEWGGAIGDVWAREWRRTDRSFAAMAPSLDAAILANAREGDVRAVDIGCGAGATSLALAAARPDAHITGVDISPGLVAVARERAAGVTDLDFRVGDAIGEVAALAPVDLFYSRHGVMFFPDPRASFTAFHDAAAPDGRLVFSCFRDISENAWAGALIAAAAGEAPPGDEGYVPGPFAFADPAFVDEMLNAAGWRDIAHQPVDYAYRAGEGPDPVGDALEFFRRIGPAARMLRVADPNEAPAMLEHLRDLLESRRTGNVIDFPAAAWIWSAKA